MQQRVVMHTCDEKIARRLALALDCAVTLSPNYPADHVTLCGFDNIMEDVLPVLRVEAPGWYVRTPDYG